MKPKININKGPGMLWSQLSLTIKGLVLGAIVVTAIQAPVQAQGDVQYTRPSWYFGAAAGANFNFYEGSTHQLNSLFTPPATFHDGRGIGLFVAPLLEYHRPDTRLGFMFQAGYDSRKGDFKQVKTPCNCPADLTTDLSYITVEPSLRFAPFKSNFYLYGGPRFAFNMTKSFTYAQGINPAYPEQVAPTDVEGDFSDISATQVSMQIGAGIDIPLSSQKRQTQFVLSPFVSFQPYIGQTPRSIETWNITTLRAGAALKLGRGHKIETPKKEEVLPVAVVVAEPEVKFSVNAPKNIPAERSVREVFPIRNYVFFDLGSNEIPRRYVLLKKEQVKDFREDQLGADAPQSPSGRSDRQMIVYYNVLNILGDRMIKNPSTSISLVGSSEKGPADGREMAESVKEYLVTVYGIDAKRITTSGRTKPVIAAEQPGGTRDLVLLREGDRRVTIESSSPVLLMEFQSGPDAPLKPVEIVTVQKAPVESYISFTVEGEEEAFTSWSLEITDDKGIVQNFGPYTEETVSIPSNTILGSRPEGDFKVVMIGQTKSGKVVKKETTSHMVLWIPSSTEEAMRFSVIYEFNKSKATSIYEKYLFDVVTPKIPAGGMVIVNGYTDITGGEENNLKLSLARANDVKSIIEKGLSKAGRTDVTFRINGNGENEKLAPFNNKYPEERFYNRTVVIDLIPGK
jgi:outer membrane protein OmpA-like peptidoglycan-associated protein